jgi:hypothetical protein
MSLYLLYFEWLKDDDLTRTATPSDLEADNYGAARVRAAIIYAGASFMQPPPDGFRIVDQSGEVVYRYPEETRH